MKIYLTEKTASFIKSHNGYINISLDLGRSENIYDADKLKKEVPLEKIKGNWVYMYDTQTKALVKVAIFSDHLYRLRMINDFPILEIDGLRMHLVKSFKTPIEYAETVCKRLNIKKDDTVLDCCTGIGYTAITAANRAKHVITIEKNWEVIEIAKANPWSKELFSMKNITLINKPGEEAITEIKDESIDRIIHDPPRLSLAPDLYSRRFYNELYRIAKPNALLFHYTGSLMKRRRDILKEVSRRLEQTGWSIKSMDRKLQGIIAKREKN